MISIISPYNYQTKSYSDLPKPEHEVKVDEDSKQINALENILDTSKPKTTDFLSLSSKDVASVGKMLSKLSAQGIIGTNLVEDSNNNIRKGFVDTQVGEHYSTKDEKVVFEKYV